MKAGSAEFWAGFLYGQQMAYDYLEALQSMCPGPEWDEGTRRVAARHFTRNFVKSFIAENGRAPQVERFESMFSGGKFVGDSSGATGMVAVMAVIANAGASGISKTQLNRSSECMSMSRAEMAFAIGSLRDMGKVIEVKTRAKTRPLVMYYAVEFAPHAK